MSKSADAIDALDAIESYCNQGLTRSPKPPVLSAEQRRIMDVVSIRIGQMTVKQVAELRGVNWRRVYEWIDEMDGKIAAMAASSRQRRRAGAEAN